MNLSAFGDIFKKDSKSKDSSFAVPAESDPSKYGHIFKMLLQNAAQTKLLHWQSGLYGQHKALDVLFSGLNDLGDKLAESLMGKYGKPVLAKDQLDLLLQNFQEPEKGDLHWFMDHLYKCYSVDCKSLLGEKGDEELINIIDEIIALVDQIRYLLSLR